MPNSYVSEVNGKTPGQISPKMLPTQYKTPLKEKMLVLALHKISRLTIGKVFFPPSPLYFPPSFKCPHPLKTSELAAHS